jgi:hypothetical protein
MAKRPSVCELFKEHNNSYNQIKASKTNNSREHKERKKERKKEKHHYFPSYGLMGRFRQHLVHGPVNFNH